MTLQEMIDKLEEIKSKGADPQTEIRIDGILFMEKINEVIYTLDIHNKATVIIG